MKNKKVSFIVTSAVVAALYVVLTYLAAAFGLASNVIQVRFSEALTILPIFTPAAIPGVSLGCLISNLVTGCAAWDVVFGSLASLIGMLGLYALKKHPFISPLPYVASNVVIVPLILRYVYGAEGSLPYFALTVGIGEIVCAWILGAALIAALKKTGADRLFRD